MAPISLDQLAVAFVLAHPFVDVALSGAATVEQLESHVTAASRRLDTVALAPLAELAETPERYWGTRAAMPWP